VAPYSTLQAVAYPLGLIVAAICAEVVVIAPADWASSDGFGSGGVVIAASGLVTVPIALVATARTWYVVFGASPAMTSATVVVVASAARAPPAVAEP
jgi:hypothetical protein